MDEPYGSVTIIPDDWEVVAYSSNNIVAAMASNNYLRFATQFHLRFLTLRRSYFITIFFNISKREKNWTADNFVNEEIVSLKIRLVMIEFW